MGGTHFLQTGYLLLNRNAPLLKRKAATFGLQVTLTDFFILAFQDFQEFLSVCGN